MRKITLECDKIVVNPNKKDLENLTIGEIGRAYYATNGKYFCKLHKVGARPRDREEGNHYGWLLMHNSFGYHSYGYETMEEAIKDLLLQGWDVRQINDSELFIGQLFTNKNP